jgi:hypothetical protein
MPSEIWSYSLRPRRAAALPLLLLAVVALMGAGCAMAPPKEATEDLKLSLTIAEAAVEDAETNAAYKDRVWAGEVAYQTDQRLRVKLDAKLKRALAAESRPTAAELLAIVDGVAVERAKIDAGLKEKLAAFDDENLPVARELIGGALEYADHELAAHRRAEKLRGMVKGFLRRGAPVLPPAAAPAAGAAPPPVPDPPDAP